MRRSLAITLVLVLVGTLAGTAGDAAAADVVPVEGHWAGTTAAGFGVAFEVRGGQVVEAHYRFRWGECLIAVGLGLEPATIEPGGHWLAPDPRGPWIEGDFVAADRVEGTVDSPHRSVPSCPRTETAFVARPSKLSVWQAEYAVPVEVGTDRVSTSPLHMQLAEDGSFGLYKLEWEGFGTPVARATGRAVLRRGCARCDGAEVRRPHVSIRLEHPVPTGLGPRTYRRLFYAFEGAIPRGFQRQGSMRLHEL